METDSQFADDELLKILDASRVEETDKTPTEEDGEQPFQPMAVAE